MKIINESLQIETNEQLPKILMRIFSVCKVDESFPLKNKMESIEEEIDGLVNRIEKQKTLVDNTTQLRNELQHKVETQQERNFEIKDLYDNVHIDIFQELSDLRDIYGNIIMLGVRYNGKQHDNNPEGFNTYKKIVGSPNVEYRSERWRLLWKDWRKLIKTDEIKRVIFEKNKKHGYYLIEVDYRIPPNQRLSYIISEFERKTGVKLPNKENADWRELLYKFRS